MTIEKEIIIFTSLPFRKYRWVSFYSVLQVCLLSSFILMMPTPKLLEQRRLALEKRKDEDNEGDESTIDELRNDILDITTKSTAWDRFKALNFREIFSVETIKDNIHERPYMTFGLTATCIATTSLFCLYVRRQAHILTLLPKDRLRFTYFSLVGLGKPRSIEVALKDVSCVADRKSDHNFSILKFRNRPLYYLVNKRDGLFIQPKLYDEYLSYERSWAKKKGE